MMKERNFPLSKGCFFIISAFAITILLGAIGWYWNHYTNQQAYTKFKKLCTEEVFIDNRNQKEWVKLEKLIESKKLNPKRLSLSEETYTIEQEKYTINQLNDRDLNGYSIILGKLRRVSVNNLLFRLRINVLIDNKKFTYIDDLIVINKEFIPGPLTAGFDSASCYDMIDSKYNRIMRMRFE